MTSIEFLYWLQGFFELSDAESLTELQAKFIKNHLDMAFLIDGAQAHSFCFYLDGYLSRFSALDYIDAIEIKEKLNDCFEHVVEQNPHKGSVPR